MIILFYLGLFIGLLILFFIALSTLFRQKLEQYMTWSYRHYVGVLLQQTQSKYTIKHIFILQITAFISAHLLAALLYPSLGYRCLIVAWVLAGLFVYWPIARLSYQRRLRFEQIQKELPFLIDMLVLLLESGMNLTMALLQLRLSHGLLQKEVQQLSSELRLGKMRQDVLQHFSQRCPPARSLVYALSQADGLGMSLGMILRQLSEQLRQDRFLLAEQKAMQAPVKMLLPLVACIFPCTLICLVFPIVRRIVDMGGF